MRNMGDRGNFVPRTTFSRIKNSSDGTSSLTLTIMPGIIGESLSLSEPQEVMMSTALACVHACVRACLHTYVSARPAWE